MIESKPTGLPTTVWYYTKIVFRALFMNAPTQQAGGDASRLDSRLQEVVDGLEKICKH